MAWYSQPIRPFDPLNPEDAPLQPERYVRDSFTGSGQDSHTLPPAQDAGQWQQLLNVQPITAGVLSQRWGYNSFATAASSKNRLTNFQRDSDGLRTLIASSPTSTEAFNEDGSVYLTNIFTPSAPPGNVVRSLTSRSYQYFYDGNLNDLNKWNGNTAGGVTNWGIAVNSNAGLLNSVKAPTSIDFNPGAAWATPNNFFATGSSFATQTIVANAGTTGIEGVACGFAIPPTATISGIKVTVKTAFSGTGHPVAYLYLTKAGSGSNYGSARTTPVTTVATTYTFGSSSDLWGGSWTPTDINNATFGVLFAGSGVTSAGTWEVNSASITVYYNGAASAITPTPGAPASGVITLTVGRIYYCVFQNSLTGQLSDLNAPSGSTGPLNNQDVVLTTIPVSSDPQVDTKVILATADGGDPSILYFVAEIPNASTTYTDNTAELTLIFNQQYLFTDQFGNEFGVSQNDPPPNGTLAIKHQGRIWMAQGQNIFFSKSVAELTLPNGFIAGKYEECWPGDNYFDISEGAETVSGLLSDGTTLYIGTQNHIRRLLGNDPTNFQSPQIIHPETGLLNQDVWQIVYREGTPAGCMWLTPDFRVIGSDFNTYTDVGKPVQDILNNIQPSAAQLAHAMFVFDGEFELYILSIPVAQTTYCDTHLIYNMRDGHWVTWQTFDGSLGSFFNLSVSGAPQWLFISGKSSTHIYQFLPTALTDNGTLIPVSATTSWMHLGSPTARKVLDEIEVIGDPGTLVTIQGASTKADFTSPNTVISSAPLITSPFGQKKVYLASSTSKWRYYQITFSTTDTNPDFVSEYNVRFNPWNTV